jgi:predicted amidohydrolase
MSESRLPAPPEHGAIYFPWGIPRPPSSIEDAETESGPASDKPRLRKSAVDNVEELFRWPPDVFAVLAKALRATGSYRRAVSPDRLGYGPELQNKSEEIRESWFASIRQGKPLPGEIADLKSILFRPGTSTDLVALAKRADTPTIEAMLRLLAYADMVCDGFGFPNAPYRRWNDIYLSANILLEVTGSLSRFPVEEGIVLPKMRTPQRGITLRSMSHYLTYHETEVAIRWRSLPWVSRKENGTSVNILAVPWPFEVYSSDFRPTDYPGCWEHPEYGYFSYEPAERLNRGTLLDLYRQARREVPRVDVLVFPELSLTETELGEVQDTILAEDCTNVPLIVAGLREAVNEADGSTRAVNQVVLCAYFAHRWYTITQDKHHRWMLDASQIRQYSLAGALNPSRKWWEAMDLPDRTLTVIAPNEWLTLCPLICEDLAQLEPVSEVIRGLGPTLVVAVLMDGPQLDQRWAARYVGVLADDPGSSVLTVTSLGMARRSRSSNSGESRVVALWKDVMNGSESIELTRGANAFLLTATARRTQEYTADGRHDGGSTASFVYHGSRLITDRRAHGRPRDSGPDGAPEKHGDVRQHDPSAPPSTAARASEADVEELSIFAYLVDAMLDSAPADRDELWKLFVSWRSAVEPTAREPFASIWKRIAGVLRTGGSAGDASRRHSAVVNADGLLNQGFGSAIQRFRNFMTRLEHEASENDSQERLSSWRRMADAAEANLAELPQRANKRRGGVNSEEAERIPELSEDERITRLVNLSVLWAIHNRIEQMRSGARGPQPRSELHPNALREASAHIEGLLDRYRC